MLISARAFAAFLHRKQKYAGLPYTYHLDQVDEILAYAGFPPKHPIRIAGRLHDVIEDCLKWLSPAAHRWIIRLLYGDEVAALVWAVTGIGPNRKARNADIYSKIVDYRGGSILKWADRTANVEASLQDPGTGKPNPSMMRMYLKERLDFTAIVKPHVKPELWARLDRAFDTCQFLLDRGGA